MLGNYSNTLHLLLYSFPTNKIPHPTPLCWKGNWKKLDTILNMSIIWFKYLACLFTFKIKFNLFYDNLIINSNNFYYIETLVVEFKQYPKRSSMRRAKLPRHTEYSAGNYGGIRKLHSQEEIQKWNQLLDRQQYV
jgi:hypothetical protein